ncbi:MAG: DUF4070 domain-containing protein [Candidatus Eremiobacteraeota bacterium]|nr:DUF4070 domain-containing protein [Candidatus Eremiobacteraeota bacterium]
MRSGNIRVLLVYPQYPDTFWSFKHILPFIAKKAAFPPLGLLTVAAMLPREWEKKLVDMNVSPLADSDIQWADYVLLSAMIVQRDSAKKVIRRCREMGTAVVAGGPLFTSQYESFEEVDYIVTGEAEVTLPRFLKDLGEGTLRHLYVSDEHPDLASTPVPLWELISMKDYVSMSVQYSRGCPFQCEFCDIIILNGRVPRVKTTAQLLGEFESLYTRGWRGDVFIVDDNFIGKKEEVKRALPEITAWMKERKNPFSLFTEASINLADDEELMRLMAETGFHRVFVGIETPEEESLAECRKHQNSGRDLVASIKRIQKHGMEVLGGFIVGFDSDLPSIFERQISFIQKSGVVVAMVGILNALPGTILYKRLKKENRLIADSSGNNADASINFLPKMDMETLMEGYRKVVRTIYSPREYCDRVITFLKECKPDVKIKLCRHEFLAFLKSIWYLGIVGKYKKYYWKLLSWSLLHRPKLFPKAVALAICGFHFQKISMC